MSDNVISKIKLPDGTSYDLKDNGAVRDVQINSTSILSNGVANIPLADNTTAGAVKVHSAFGITTYGGYLTLFPPLDSTVKAGTAQIAPILASNQHLAAFYGLAKAAGADEKNSQLTAGTYSDTAKTAIRTMLGAVGDSDYASTTTAGVIKVGTRLSINASGVLSAPSASVSIIKQGSSSAYVLTPDWIHGIAFYGLAKAAGADEKDSNLSLGTYSDTAKTAIRTMLGAIGTADYATSSTYGLVKLSGALRPGSQVTGGNAGSIYVQSASLNGCKTGTSDTFPLTPSVQHAAAFYGLAKAAGDSTQSASSNSVGTYTDTAKTAIRSMLGAVGTADYASTSAAGVIKMGSQKGLSITDSGELRIRGAYAAEVKAGTHEYFPVTPKLSHYSAFYGLAKAAGADMSSSSNEIGTYTSAAKTAIQNMIGVENGVTYVENINDTDVLISGIANTRYICGTVSTISITPPSAGIIDVIFTSGTSPAVLTLPSTVKLPAWFDKTTLDTETTYEINIADGVFGAVMTWA